MPRERDHVTAEDLLRMPDDGTRRELLRGCLRRRPLAGAREGSVAARLTSAVHRHVEARGLGLVVPGGTGFLLDRNPDTVLAPAAAFVARDRLPAELPAGCFPGPPDLAAEVVSPSDRFAGVRAKVQDWLRAGCRLVWVVEPEGRTVGVYAGEDRADLLEETEVLDGGEALPGFAMPLRELFA